MEVRTLWSFFCPFASAKQRKNAINVRVGCEICEFCDENAKITKINTNFWSIMEVASVQRSTFFCAFKVGVERRFLTFSRFWAAMTVGAKLTAGFGWASSAVCSPPRGQLLGFRAVRKISLCCCRAAVGCLCVVYCVWYLALALDSAATIELWVRYFDLVSRLLCGNMAHTRDCTRAL